MKKLIIICLCLVVSLFVFCGCECRHDWSVSDDGASMCAKCGISQCDVEGHDWSASDDGASMCVKCGISQCDVEGHDWSASDDGASMCAKCGISQCDAEGHDWLSRNCQRPETCSRCGTVEGNIGEHDWTEASCTAPKTCKICGESKGWTKNHEFGDWQRADENSEERLCTVCAHVETRQYDHSADFYKLMYHTVWDSYNTVKFGSKIKNDKIPRVTFVGNHLCSYTADVDANVYATSPEDENYVEGEYYFTEYLNEEDISAYKFNILLRNGNQLEEKHCSLITRLGEQPTFEIRMYDTEEKYILFDNSIVIIMCNTWLPEEIAAAYEDGSITEDMKFAQCAGIFTAQYEVMFNNQLTVSRGLDENHDCPSGLEISLSPDLEIIRSHSIDKYYYEPIGSETEYKDEMRAGPVLSHYAPEDGRSVTHPDIKLWLRSDMSLGVLLTEESGEKFFIYRRVFPQS